MNSFIQESSPIPAKPEKLYFIPFKWGFKLFNALLISSTLLVMPQIGWAQGQPQIQDLRLINQKVKEFLTAQSAGSPGKVEITITPMEQGTRLDLCPNPEAFFPPSSAAWGRTTVGVRCSQPKPWTVYLQANVSIIANYVVAANPLGQGQTINPNDLQLQKGDITALPTGIFTEISPIIGTSAKMTLAAGTVIKKEMLKMPIVIQQGQSVRVASKGTGFSITTEGQALNAAAEGEITKVRVNNGSVVTGIARKDGQVEVGGKN
ncbi:flagellar basal body P-ring formation chaperone FlgA [Polynucleobacter sp. CS-Odin-A6]|uniref:flagellar basal body P-ring formation chaperone FlgA n=1 Tax=Polynucleobacter sp. CS-Odin-A6 TaxID=2689106 RepID=UPI001C0BDA3A|nr:flagellar basal body P-ring formation chaperone FlgA [Polynucleobacter sp. CS-Odin-A6]MBU3621865.1 flagellar basal body P-ring formation protein FlgA [Polynucleobacter sp. CS-Odin-A6]